TERVEILVSFVGNCLAHPLLLDLDRFEIGKRLGDRLLGRGRRLVVGRVGESVRRLVVLLSARRSVVAAHASLAPGSSTISASTTSSSLLAASAPGVEVAAVPVCS